MKIKMVDIARHLGVSKATVSLAVNGRNQKDGFGMSGRNEKEQRSNSSKREYRYSVWPSGESDDQNSDC